MSEINMRLDLGLQAEAAENPTRILKTDTKE